MNVLVTGGAGFIGSHLVDALIGRGDEVRVLDNLASGLAENVNRAAKFIEGDITDEHVVDQAVDGVEIVFHQAALGSVRRSVEFPRATDTVNVHGALNVLEAARQHGVRRVISASSSSVYGGVAPLPTSEDHPVAPKSPYAVSKFAGEQYSRVYAELMGVETVVLRYFNVYGPRQRADSPYAAVIPLFIDALSSGRQPIIEGDGEQSRDFTYVADAVDANILAATAPANQCSGRVYNVAGGTQHTILELLATLGELLEVETTPTFKDPRPGDVRHSQADLSAIHKDLGYDPRHSLRSGLEALLADVES